MDTLRFYMVTWNVATRSPEEDVKEMLGIPSVNSGASNSELPDFYVIGLQEVKSLPHNVVMDAILGDPWTDVYRNVLVSHGYIKVKTVKLQGILLSLFCLRKHLLHLREIDTRYTKTGFGGLWGNKGAVSIRMSIYGCSVCLVNCHLTPHDSMVQDRIADYNTIIKSHTYQIRETSNILFHDYVFWIGDMNFRLVDAPGFSAKEIDDMVQKGNLNTLLAKDELQQVMSSGEAFSELVEQKLTFPPTYKFQIHSSSYDLKRRPSWTDRILYKVNPDTYEDLKLNVRQLSYNSCSQYKQSDHKPVIAEFIIKVFSEVEENVVTFHPVKEWNIDGDNTVTYVFSVEMQPAFWDWIGVYKDGFDSLDDFKCYSYAPRVTASFIQESNSILKRVVFPPCCLQEPGLYRLLYFSDNSGSVLGMSEVFQAVSRGSRAFDEF